jgi:O-antigen/teichoic acid export membrane protein
MMRLRVGRLSPTTWITSEKVAQQILWFALFAVLGPILGPKPYGLFALAMVVIGFCELVLAEAAAEALLSIPEMSQAHVGTANVCNVVAGVLAGLVAAGVGQLLAWTMNEPIVAAIFLALSPLPLLSSLVASPTALLKRDMQFKQFAVRSITGLTIGGALGIAAALSGFGVWALVIQVVAQRMAEVVVLWASAPKAFALSWSRSCFADLRQCAFNVFAARSWTWVAAQAPRLIVGWMLGPTNLGLFTLATRVADVLLQVVLVPAAQIARLEMRRYADDLESLEEAMKRLLRDVGILAFPISIGLAAVAPTLCGVWLGPSWSGSGVGTAIMVLTICPWTYFYCSTAVMMGLGLSKLDVTVQAVLGLSSAAATVLAAPFGLNAVCWALLFRLVVLVALPLLVLRKGAGQDPLKLFLAPIGLLVAAGFMGGVVQALTPAITHFAGRLLALPALVAAGVVVYGVIVILTAPNDARRLLGVLGQRLPAPI